MFTGKKLNTRNSGSDHERRGLIPVFSRTDDHQTSNSYSPDDIIIDHGDHEETGYEDDYTDIREGVPREAYIVPIKNYGIQYK